MQRIALYLKIHAWAVILITLVAVGFLFGSLHIYGDGSGNYFLYRQIIEENWTLSIANPPLDLPGAYIFVQGRHGWSTFYQIGAPLVWGLLTPFTFFLPALSPAFSDIFGLPSFLLYDGLVLLALSAVLSIGILVWWIHVLQTIFQFSLPVSVVAVLVSFVGLPSWYYAFMAPSYAHIVELLFLTLTLSFFFSALRRPSSVMFVASGVFLGVAALVRIDALLFLFACAWAILVWFRRAATRPLLCMVAPFLLVASVQFLVWHSVFGSVFPSFGYRPDNFALPLHTADILFSDSRGFFLWSPIALVGYLGIGHVLRGRRALHWVAACMGTMALLLYALFYGSWGMWWGGLSFGQRFLIPLFPFVAFGVAAACERLQQMRRIMRGVGACIVSIAVVYSWCLAMLYPTVAQWGDISIKKDAHPLEVFRYALHQYRLSDPSQWRSGWRAWYNATPRPAHLVLPPE